MSTCRQAIRARRKARIDPRYIKTKRGDAAVRARKQRAKWAAEAARKARPRGYST